MLKFQVESTTKDVLLLLFFFSFFTSDWKDFNIYSCKPRNRQNSFELPELYSPFSFLFGVNVSQRFHRNLWIKLLTCFNQAHVIESNICIAMWWISVDAIIFNFEETEWNGSNLSGHYIDENQRKWLFLYLASEFKAKKFSKRSRMNSSRFLWIALWDPIERNWNFTFVFVSHFIVNFRKSLAHFCLNRME